jgi:hypothetical protein
MTNILPYEKLELLPPETEYSNKPTPRHVKHLDELIAELDDLISK